VALVGAGKLGQALANLAAGEPGVWLAIQHE